MTNTLVLGHEGRGINFDTAYDYWTNQPEVRVEVLSKAEQNTLAKVLKKLSARNYENIILDQPFKRLVKQQRCLKPYKQLTCYEEDGTQDRIPHSKWYGKFSRFYKQLPAIRVISTGFQTTQHFRQQGIDAHFVAKGFDEAKVSDLNQKRSLDAAFVGRTKSTVYSQRAEFLETLASENLISLERSAAEEYNALLNQITIFVSADLGLGEYMAKNFEAMAAGCAVLAYAQGRGEENALGLVDMHNIALYSNIDEARAKLALLKSNKELCAKISHNGKLLTLKNRNHTDIARSILTLARQPFTKHKPVRTTFPALPSWMRGK